MVYEICFTRSVTNADNQHCQRFMWRNGDRTREPDVYVLKVMSFGATCSTSMAQFVKNTNAQIFAGQFPAAFDAVIKNHYVDDLLISVETETEAVQLAKELRFIHIQGGFEIRN